MKKGKSKVKHGFMIFSSSFILHGIGMGDHFMVTATCTGGTAKGIRKGFESGVSE